ncbi:MAG TPA: chemotaxis protein CheW [Bryobacteraceae bacterium]|nr:chemotaxis protein CheW [Bryobacteraceae bacterium]
MRKYREIDWAATRRQLERSREAVERSLEPDAEKVAAILRARAERLAQPPAAEPQEDQESTVLVFQLGEDRYGIDLERVTQVISNPPCAPVPGAPEQLAGVIQVRGEIRPVWDTARLLGRADDAAGDSVQVLLLNGKRREFGLRVDRIEGISRFRAGERRAAQGQPGYVRYVTEDLVAVVDLEELLKQTLS